MWQPLVQLYCSPGGRWQSLSDHVARPAQSAGYPQTCIRAAAPLSAGGDRCPGHGQKCIMHSPHHAAANVNRLCCCCPSLPTGGGHWLGHGQGGAGATCARGRLWCQLAAVDDRHAGATGCPLAAWLAACPAAWCRWMIAMQVCLGFVLLSRFKRSVTQLPM